MQIAGAGGWYRASTPQLDTPAPCAVSGVRRIKRATSRADPAQHDHRAGPAGNGNIASNGGQVLFELRQYKIREGHKENWVRLMEDEIIPFQVAQGMVILGSFTGEDDDSIYVWIRRFKDEAERERLYAAVYDSDHWKENIGPRIPEMMDREAINVIRLDPTAKSPLQ
jgi:hypothetical protein